MKPSCYPVSILLTTLLIQGYALAQDAGADILQIEGNSFLSSETVLNKDQLSYYYRFFSDTTYLAPTRFQEETLRKAEDIYGITLGWRPSPPTEEDFAEVSESTLKHYHHIRQMYPTFRIVYTNDAEPSLVSKPETVTITKGLQTVFFIEIDNQSDGFLNLEPMLVESGPTGRVPTGIEAGAQIPIIMPVNVRTGDGSVGTLQLIRHGSNQVDEFSVELKFEEPVIVKGKTTTSDGTPFSARLYARGADGILRHGVAFANITTLSEKAPVFRPALYKLPFFYTDGTYEVHLPPGEAEFTIERGFESPLSSETVNLEAGKEAEFDIATDRGIDMMKRGWISGDTHIHWAINIWNENEDIELLSMVQRAEDLRIANNLTLYQYLPDGQSFTKPDQYGMGPVEHLSDEQYHLEMGEEFRNDAHFGHINLLNLESLIEPVATGQGSGGPPGTIDWPINKWIIDQARAQGGISIEAHNLGPFNASGVVVNVIQGYSDSLDQLEPEHYYDFLNSGIKIGLSNGSDHPARIAGVCRVYARSGMKIDYDAWCDAVASGKTFTTSGPMLFLDVNGQDIGDTIVTDGSETLTVSARAWSRYPIGNLQIVSNGNVVASIETQDLEAELTFETTAEESKWFVARASQSDDYNALNGPHIAHTSAIYTELNGEAVLRDWSIQKWLTNLDIHRQRLIGQATFENEDQKMKTLEYIDGARAKYQALLTKLQQDGNK